MPTVFTPGAGGSTHDDDERPELAYTAPGVNVLLHAAVTRTSWPLSGDWAITAR